MRSRGTIPQCLLLGTIGLGLVACVPASAESAAPRPDVVATTPTVTLSGHSSHPPGSARPKVAGTAVPAPEDTAAAGPAVSQPVVAATRKPVAHARAGTALAVLATLPVKGRAPRTGYDRSLFGQAWTDDVSAQGGHNGCDTRNDVLRRDLRPFLLKPGTQGCVALSGTLADAYTGTRIAFVRGQDTSSFVQIDHVVALSNAWQTGAGRLAPERRRALANDPLNLWAVQGRANLQKGDGDAATWLPSNKAVRCLYVARQVAVKARYALWVTPPEREAIERILNGCPTQPLPNTAGWATPPPDRNAAPAVRTAPPPKPVPPVAAPPPSKPPARSVSYQNCTAVRAAGADPIRRGQPGYARHLDRDGDGVGCE